MLLNESRAFFLIYKNFIYYSDMQAVIEIKNLTWGYEKSKENIFQWFNFQLEQGDFCFIMGKSWVWKTSLIKLLMWALKIPPETIFFEGKDLSRSSTRQIQEYRKELGIILQDCKLLDRKNVSQNIRYPLDIQGKLSENEIQKKLDEVLLLLQLTHKKDSEIVTLSWWEKQRVAIARAIVHNPKFIIADEATGNLDEETSKEVMKYLLDVHSKGITVLCITHDQGLVDYCRSEDPRIKIVQL